MVKIIIAGRRRAGLTRAGLSCHLRQVHGPMVVSPPEDAGPMPAGYVQNHVRDGVYPASGPAMGVELDFVTEVWFASPELARASLATPYYETVLRPDEPRFVNLDSVWRCLAIEEEVKAATVTGSHKAFLFWAGVEGFEQAWGEARAVCNGRAQRWVANHTRPMPGAPSACFAGVDEVWLEDGADVQPVYDAMLERLSGHVDAAACCFVVVEEFTTQRLRG